jgi:1,4-dihydroxy-2-naphthoyl-CoA hydrolase
MMAKTPEAPNRTALPTEQWNALGKGYLPGLIGIEILEIEAGRTHSRLAIRPELMAPNGFLHAATVAAIADTSCGYATMADLPPGATGFTTIELKCNFLGTVRGGAILCEATPQHKGRTTHVWDARVYSEGDERTLALFRCTQMILYPRSPAMNLPGT